LTTTLTISARERDTLHGLMFRRLLILAERTSELAKAEGITVEQVCERFGDDLRLMEEIGWVFEAGQESIELAMPHERLAETLKRLRRDARRAPFEMRHEREPEESVDERWRRFRQAVEVCEELLCRLDSLASEEVDPEPISAVSPEQAKAHELTSYVPSRTGSSWRRSSAPSSTSSTGRFLPPTSPRTSASRAARRLTSISAPDSKSCDALAY
jgi:hypothetical protein